MINLDDGNVFGQAWICDDHQKASLARFETWIQGDWEPRVYSDVKPVPVGTDYPERAVVESCITIKGYHNILRSRFQEFSTFNMVRGEQDMAKLAEEHETAIEKLLCLDDVSDGSIKRVCAWPSK